MTRFTGNGSPQNITTMSQSIDIDSSFMESNRPQTGAAERLPGNAVLPTISVVIPAFNAGPMLREAVRSAIDQQYPPLQVIVVDDGSTDEPRRTLGPLLEQVDFICQENRGVSAARNVGSRAANGEYIAYLDADDLWQPNKLAVVARCIVAADRPGVVIDDFFRVDAQGRRLPRNMDLNDYCRKCGASFNLDGVSGRILLARQFLALLVQGFQVNPPALVVRSDVLAESGLWNQDIRRSEDFELGLRLAMLTDLLLVDEPLTIVRRHESHGSEDAYLLAAMEADLAILRRHFASLSTEPSIAPVLGRRLLGIAWSLRHLGQHQLARDACWLALRPAGNRLRALAALSKSLWQRSASRLP